MNVTDQFVAGIRSHGIGKLLTQIISWAGTIYVFRLLNSDELGAFAIAVAVVNFASVVFDGTLMDSLVQHPPRDTIARRAVFTSLLIIGAVLTLFLSLVAWPVAAVIGDARVGPLVLLMCTVFVIGAFGVMPNASLVADMRFDRLAWVSAISGLGSLALTISLVKAGAGAWGLASGFVFGVALRTGLLNFYRTCLFMPCPRLRSALPHMKMGGVLILDALLWRLYTSMDVLLLGRWWSTAAAGTYDFAQQLAHMPLEKVTTIVNDVALPAYARLADDRVQAARLMLETIRTHAVFGFPLFWGIASVADLAIPLVFGEQWAVSVTPLIALAVIGPLKLIGSIETPAMTGLGTARVLLASKARTVPPMLVAVSAGCWFAGVDGIALAWLTVFPICYTWGFRLVLAQIGLHVRQVIRAIRGPSISAGLMAAAILACPGIDNPIATLAVRIGVGLMVYPLVLWIVDRRALALTMARIARILVIRRCEGS